MDGAKTGRLDHDRVLARLDFANQRRRLRWRSVERDARLRRLGADHETRAARLTCNGQGRGALLARGSVRCDRAQRLTRGERLELAQRVERVAAAPSTFDLPDVAP